MIKQNNRSLIIAIALIVFASLWRLIPHMPNFSPVLAIALFSGLIIGNKKIAIVLPLGLLLISDLFLGFHTSMLAVYLCIFLLVLGGFALRNNFSYLKGIGTVLAGSLMFFIVTNFYFWLFSGMYQLSISGLVDCYTRAIPFFRTAIFGDLSFSIVLYTAFRFASITLPERVKSK